MLQTHKTGIISEKGSRGDQRHVTAIIKHSRTLLHKEGEGRKEGIRGEKSTGTTAIAEFYKIMSGMQKLGKEQKLTASSHKGPKEKQLELRNLKAIKEGNCTYNTAELPSAR